MLGATLWLIHKFWVLLNIYTHLFYIKFLFYIKVERKSVKIRSSVTLVAFMFICLRRLERNLFYRYLNMASVISQKYCVTFFVGHLIQQCGQYRRNQHFKQN